MIGFEINVKGQTIFSAVENGVSSVIVTQISKEGTNSIDLNISALDTSDEQIKKNIYWLDCPLEEGDTFTVKVKDLQEISDPLNVKVTEHNQEEEDKKNVKRYYALKKKLEDKGLI